MIFGKRGNNGLDRDAVMRALATVNDPELHKDVVSLGMVKDVKIDGGAVRLNLELTTPACPLKEVFQRDVKAALEKVPGFESVTIDFSSNVMGRAMGQGDLAPGVRNIIAVASGKGGVGKSTVSVNLALSLAKTGARVGLLDADIYGPNIPIMLGLKEPPRVVENRMVPLEAHGLKVISMGVLIPEGQAVIWRGPMLNSALRQFFSDVDWGELDYLIVDLPPGTGDVQISLVQLVKVTGCVIVTTPQDVALQDVRRGIAMLRQTNTPVLGLIENMAWFRCDGCEKIHYIFGQGGGERMAKEVGIPLLGQIPLGQVVREGGDAGRPVTLFAPECQQSEKFMEIAQALAAAVSVKNAEMAAAGGLEIKIGPQ